MAHQVFLHVGLPKSGTTYLQAVLAKNKERLKEQHRLLYPGGGWGDQVNAVKEIRRLGGRSQRADVKGAWSALVEEVAAWDGDVVVSMEWLCAASSQEIERMVTDLQPAEVHVVFTVRDLARNIPAFWQESTQNRQVWTWSRFLESVSTETQRRSAPGRKFWSQQDMRELLPRWTEAVPASRVHVVTLPQSGADPEELWQRMVQVLGLPADAPYVLRNLGANQSLGMESAELMRRVNQLARDASLDHKTYNRVFKRALAKRVLASRRDRESKVVLPSAYHAWVRGKAEDQIAAIEEAGVDVVGDLDDLRPVLTPGKSRTPVAVQEPTAEALLDVAIEALVRVALDADAAAGKGQGREHALAGRIRSRRLSRGRITAALRSAAREAAQRAPRPL